MEPSHARIVGGTVGISGASSGRRCPRQHCARCPHNRTRINGEEHNIDKWYPGMMASTGALLCNDFASRSAAQRELDRIPPIPTSSDEDNDELACE